MTDSRQALVLHLATGGEPILFAVTAETVQDLNRRLPELIRQGGVTNLTVANGAEVTVNFAHVAAAHVDSGSFIGQVYGSARRTEAGYHS